MPNDYFHAPQVTVLDFVKLGALISLFHSTSSISPLQSQEIQVFCPSEARHQQLDCTLELCLSATFWVSHEPPIFFCFNNSDGKCQQGVGAHPLTPTPHPSFNLMIEDIGELVTGEPQQVDS